MHCTLSPAVERDLSALTPHVGQMTDTLLW